MLPALLAAAALSAALFTARLPPGPDFILPRRGGYSLFKAGWALSSSPNARFAFSIAVSVILIGALAWLLKGLWRSAKSKRPRGKAWVGLAIGPLFALVLAWRLRGAILDLVQLVWFPYGSLDAREPAIAFLLLAAVFVSAAIAARAWTEGRRKAATKLLIGLLISDVVTVAAGRFYHVGEAFPLESNAKTAYVALTTTPDGPARDVYVMSPGAFGKDPRPDYYRRLAGPRTAHTMHALRALYQAETMRWDIEGLRGSLLLGASLGDGLAHSLLLSHLETVRPSAAGAAAVGALADESAYRIGPLGAARIARAYAHQGDKAKAKLWATAATIPAGLLGIDKANPAKGTVTGVIKGPTALKVALYKRPDAAAPYLLDAAALVAAADPDLKGRFRFDGLTAGRYFIAAAFPAGPQGLTTDVTVTGHRGDILIDSKKADVKLPDITLKLK